MFGNSFYYILNMSIMASVVFLVIVALRFLFSKSLSKSLLVLFWLVVLFRLLVPFSIESPISIANVFKDSTIKEVEIRSNVIDEEAKMDLVFSNYIQVADDYEPIAFESNQTTNWFKIMGIIWLIGVFVMLCYFIIVYYMFRRLNKDAVLLDVSDSYSELKVKCYLCNHIDTPMVIGIIKPFILIPKGDYHKLSHKIKKVILQHENAHISRKDNLLKLMFGLGLCLHWFNPFIWLMTHIISKDIELACDEKVLKGLERAERKNYVLALLDYGTSTRLHATAFGNSDLKNRIFSIVNYKQKNIYMIVITSFICLVLAFILLTNPMK